MKNNEVMIGDWLRFTDPNNTEETEFSQITTEIIGFDSPKYWRCFSPVEITPEILEANGFEKYGNRCGIWINKKDFDNHTEINYRIDQNWFDLKKMANRLYTHQLKCEVHYVHELQHLLRVAGLNDMADNFKIEKGGSK